MALRLGICGDPRGKGASYEQGTPVRRVSAWVWVWGLGFGSWGCRLGGRGAGGGDQRGAAIPERMERVSHVTPLGGRDHVTSTSSGSIPRNQAERDITWTDHSPGYGMAWAIDHYPGYGMGYAIVTAKPL